MIIEVLNQKQAIEYAGFTGMSTSIISITSREDADVYFPENPNIVSILHMKFNDLTEEYDEEGIPYGRAMPQPEDFAGLSAFVTGLTCDILIVHCWEGKSRSVAVATAIYDFRGRKDELRIKKEAVPNPRVYMLAFRELEI
jgi:predicted protein tyrosine phosphatase